jgi:hypothetical protein
VKARRVKDTQVQQADRRAWGLFIKPEKPGRREILKTMEF